MTRHHLTSPKFSVLTTLNRIWFWVHFSLMYCKSELPLGFAPRHFHSALCLNIYWALLILIPSFLCNATLLHSTFYFQGSFFLTHPYSNWVELMRTGSPHHFIGETNQGTENVRNKLKVLQSTREGTKKSSRHFATMSSENFSSTVWNKQTNTTFLRVILRSFVILAFWIFSIPDKFRLYKKDTG